MKTYHKFDPFRFKGLRIGLMFMSAFWLTWTIAYAQSVSPDPGPRPQPEVAQPLVSEAPVEREGAPQPKRGVPAPTGIGRSWVELAPQWPAWLGDAPLPDERIGPAAPLVGSLYVNSTEDIVSSNSQLTLREAILVANGVLTGPFTLAEQAQMSGCTFNASGFITGGCGAGIVDYIFFASTLGFRPVITLRTPLPPINDTRATHIFGAFPHNVQPVINAQNLTTGQDGLVINSNGNSISGISVINAPRDGIVLNGHRNTVNIWTMVRNNRRYGIYITGMTNTVSSSYIGVFSNTVTNRFECDGNHQDGIHLRGSAQATTIQKNQIGCNGFNGIAVSHSSDNLIGGSSYITHGNKIYDNQLSGIKLTGEGATHNLIQANDIYRNRSSGIYIEAAQQNTITVGSSASDYNWIVNNRHDGVLLHRAMYNLLAGASIVGNRHGVKLSYSHFNVISRTTILNNSGDGISQNIYSSANVWLEMSIRDNGGLGIDTNVSDSESDIPHPPSNFFITSVNQNTGLVQGKASRTADGFSAIVDLYRIDLDPSGYGEGYEFVGSDMTDAHGNWSITDPYPSRSRGCYTAVVRGQDFLFPYATEFARTNCETFVPIVRRP
jgi:CSLREA domain-containing protein